MTPTNEPIIWYLFLIAMGKFAAVTLFTLGKPFNACYQRWFTVIQFAGTEGHDE